MALLPRVLAVAGAVALATVLTVGSAAATGAPTLTAGASRPGATSAAPRDGECRPPRLEQPPRRVNSPEYNQWLGSTFSGVALNLRSAEERTRLINRIVDPGYIQHNPLLPEGPEGVIGFLGGLYQSFPDVCFTVRDSFATRDRVVTRSTITGTLTGGPFLGIEARGQKIEFDLVDVWTVRNGKLYEHWDQFDWPRGLIQLGVEGLPEPFVQVALQPVDR